MSGLDWRFPLNIDFENWICYSSNIKHSISPVRIHIQICEKKRKGLLQLKLKHKYFVIAGFVTFICKIENKTKEDVRLV